MGGDPGEDDGDKSPPTFEQGGNIQAVSPNNLPIYDQVLVSHFKSG